MTIPKELSKEFPKKSSQRIPPKEFHPKNSIQRIPPKEFHPKNSSQKILPKKFLQKNSSKKSSKRIPKKFQATSQKIFWKYPIPYIALRGRKPFRACLLYFFSFVIFPLFYPFISFLLIWIGTIATILVISAIRFNCINSSHKARKVLNKIFFKLGPWTTLFARGQKSHS